jgi:hypothetical protein
MKIEIKYMPLVTIIIGIGMILGLIYVMFFLNDKANETTKNFDISCQNLGYEKFISGSVVTKSYCVNDSTAIEVVVNCNRTFDVNCKLIKVTK